MKHARVFIAGKPTAVDLFCGAGGLSEGLRQAGFRVIGAVEEDALACVAYRSNHRGAHLWELDIRRLSGAAVLRKLGLKRGELDLLAACPPCQGFSTLRTKNGQRSNRDRRNGLTNDVLRLVRCMRPKGVMLENVPALARSRHYDLFRKGLEALGYKVKWAILDAADFGVPQKRRRLVVLASRAGTPDFGRQSRIKRTVRDAIESLPPPLESRDPLHNYPVQRSEKVMRLIRAIPPDGGSRSALGHAAQLECHQACDGFHDVYGRMAWDKPGPTITGGCINPSKGRFLHPVAHRAITLREAALLQSFPKSYRFPVADGGKYAVALLIGNALPPEFVRRHALTLRLSLRTRQANSTL